MNELIDKIPKHFHPAGKEWSQERVIDALAFRAFFV
jgi:hypothetical protein